LHALQRQRDARCATIKSWNMENVSNVWLYLLARLVATGKGGYSFCHGLKDTISVLPYQKR